ncbi:hypothetical protein T4D_8378 [Trichinella pseudospiralis]|uniref:Uncharacterized protein n=1 Tax=Trichinella pseudospiralis TaxID=6337 RepID=A0A0V1EX31_TRIPS|nr:hypothetical protein T4D_8378 [Trichinella pseudospiralis]
MNCSTFRCLVSDGIFIYWVLLFSNSNSQKISKKAL